VEPILLVTNAAAGTNEQEAVDAVVAVLREGAEVEVAATGTPEELDDVLSRLDGRWVVAAGGDGTLHALVNALWRSRLLGSTTLGLIPLGTGNDFARGVEIPLDPEQAARLVIAGKATETDLIVDDEDTVIVNNVHLGVGAQASRKAEKWKPRFGKLGIGRIGYAVGALSAGLRPRFLKVEVEVDGVRLGGRELTRGRSVAQVAIGNGSHVGGGTELIPGADPTSGRLVVIVSRNRSIWSRLSYLVRLRVGTHHLMREVTQVTGTEVSVRGEKFYCVSDGEISGPHTQKSWRLHRGAVSLLRP
jgi:diacylglycerol kinase family enzyme